MDISQITVPEGIDPDLFWNAVREALDAVKQAQDDTTATQVVEPEPEAPVVPTVPDVIAVREGVINAATYTITAVEGGRYGQVKVEAFGTGAATTEQQDGDDTQRVRAKRANPADVKRHILATMFECIKHENKPGRSNFVSRPDCIGWAITIKQSRNSAVSNFADSEGNVECHYRWYNGRDLIKDVAHHTNVTYTPAQIRTALTALVESGEVKEDGKISKSKRYTLPDEKYVAAVNAGKGE